MPQRSMLPGPAPDTQQAVALQASSIAHTGHLLHVLANQQLETGPLKPSTADLVVVEEGQLGSSG